MSKAKFDRGFYTYGYTKVDPDVYGGEIDGFEAYSKDVENSHGKISAMVFFGKRAKPDWHYLFSTEAAAYNKINEAAKRQTYSNEFKLKRKAEKQAFVPDVKVGDIFGTSWGYDQTNREFYEVVSIPSPKTVELREIAQDITEKGFMAGETKPVPGKYIGEPFRKRVGEGNSITFESYRHGHKIDPNRTFYVSWYA